MSRWAALPPPLTSQRGTTSPSSTSSPRHLPSSSPRSLALASTHTPSLPSTPSHIYRSSSHADSTPHPPQHFTYTDDEDLPSHNPQPPPSRSLRLTPSSSPAPSPASHSTSSTPPRASRPLPSLAPAPNPSSWEDDDSVDNCHQCGSRFSLFLRKHHCRACGLIFCDHCSRSRQRVGTAEEPVRVCDSCNAHITAQEGAVLGQPSAASASASALLSAAATAPSKKGRPSAEPPMPHMQLNSSPPSPPNPSSPPPASSNNTPSTLTTPLLAALVQELRCMGEVMKAERAIREEVEAMLLLVAGEVVERAGAAGVGVGRGGGEEGEVERLRRRVDELEEEVAALRAAAEGQAGVR